MMLITRAKKNSLPISTDTGSTGDLKIPVAEFEEQDEFGEDFDDTPVEEEIAVDEEDSIEGLF